MTGATCRGVPGRDLGGAAPHARFVVRASWSPLGPRRGRQHRCCAAMGASAPSCTTVSVIDLGPVLTASDENAPAYRSTAGEIAAAASSLGVFHVVGHGVDKGLREKAAEAQRWFFQQPKDVKAQIRRSPENSRGWFDDELTKQKRDWKEGFDMGPDGVADDVNGVNQWLDGAGADSPALSFRTTMVEYYEEVTGLAHLLTQLLSVGLGMPANHFDAHFQGHSSLMRLNYYPLCDDPAAHLGISPHRDQVFVTVLAQNDISGLQVYTGDGDGMTKDDPAWVTVQPVPDAFVINIGDLFQVASNDRFKAPLHRVLANKSSERYSVPFFYQPSLDAVLEPVPGMIDDAHPPAYRPLHFGEMRRRRIEGDLADNGVEVQISDYKI
mmetsp:Transcript_24798/g.62362  ORF Transcript_24798/g.62362 Transcript_24798/m.62362 type:complete len:382 (-) Transcript_24798:782-1927(-)